MKVIAILCVGLISDFGFRISEAGGVAPKSEIRNRISAGGDEKKNVDVVCPVDGFKFTAVEITSTNKWGGIDRDFCWHALKTRPIEFLVWVCPSCGFAGVKKDFEAKLEDATKKKLLDGLQPVGLRKGMKQADIPAWAKYDLLAQVAKIKESDRLAVANAYLSAAWCHRQVGAVSLDEFDEWTQLYESLHLNKPPMELGVDKEKKAKNRTEFDLEIARDIEKGIGSGRWRGLNLHLARHIAAYVYRKHGENADALRLLEELKKSKTENSVIDDAVVRMLKSIDAERDFQKKALAEFEAAYDSGRLEKKPLSEVAYMLGELQRRLGEKAKASDWYRKALDGSSDDGLKKLATEQLQLVK